jgi:Flp pilus assembly protein CpaB
MCCGLAASATVQALRPAPPALRSVVVPVPKLPAGPQVQPDDVAVVPLPASLAPDTALTDPADAVGRVPAVTLEAGLPLSAGLVAGGEVAALAPDGTVVVPVRLDDATAALLRPGDHVDLVSTAYLTADTDAAGHPTGDAAAYLARRALVLPTGSRDDDATGSGGLLGGSTGSGTATVTLVAVTPAEAPPLSAASGTGTLAAVLVP